jgi:hypothetical protein
MNVVICSSFRQSATYLDRYFAQIDALDRLLTKRGDVLSLVLGYGDSTDDTAALLFEHTSGGMVGARLIDVSHGGPVFTSIVDAQRFKQLAYVANKVLANAPDDADAIVWIEADLIWEPGVVVELLNHLRWHGCAAPMIMDSPPKNTWYDTFAFIKNGVNFTKEPPFHPHLEGKLFRMDSVGSLVALRGDVARNITIPEDNVIVGACAQVRDMGQTIVLDSTLVCYHP